MKDRQRWQPEEDGLLRAYVKQYGPKEWNLISQRMGKPLDRDPKSCLERWKNYLKPGIKKGSLTPEEQSLVISLQSKYGNKWKKIADEVPGRTAKRLGKWWEVFKEKQLKHLHKTHQFKDYPSPSSAVSATTASPESAAQGKYDHILETFAEKYVQPKLYPGFHPNAIIMPPAAAGKSPLTEPPPVPVLSLGTVAEPGSAAMIPAWMNLTGTSTSTSSQLTSSSSTTPSPSVSLTLSPSEPVLDPEIGMQNARFMPVQQMAALVQMCKEVEEGKESWMRHKKEATWRLSRLEQQLEAEKARRRREKTEEIEERIRSLREEEMGFVDRVEAEYREQLNAVQRDAEAKEAKLMEAWCRQHLRLGKMIEQMGVHGFSSFSSSRS